MPLKQPITGDQLALFDLATYSPVLGSNDQGDTSEALPNTVKPGKSCDAHHWIEEKFIPRSGKLHGPYLYLRWRQDGKLKSKYLGRSLFPVRRIGQTSDNQPSQT